jgi:hypothetical protein
MKNKSYADGAHPGAAGDNTWMAKEQQSRSDEDLQWGATEDMDWDMMLETGSVGTIAQRRRKMRVMFNTRPTHDFVRKQWDDEHDSRCSCGGQESLEHVVMESRRVCKELYEEGYGNDDNAKRAQHQSWHRCFDIYVVPMSLGKMYDYESKEQVPTFGTKKTEARRWLADGTFPVWLGFVKKGWVDMKDTDETIQSVVKLTRKVRKIMNEGCWEMWTGRCNKVHEKDNDVTQAGWEKVFSVSGAPAVLGSACFGLRRTDKTIVEVLYMKLVQRQAWMVRTKGMYNTTTQ